jgi:phage-related protein
VGSSSLKDLRTFPDPVKDEVGFALYLAQIGSKGENTKVLKGFSGAGVIEVLENYDGIHTDLYIRLSSGMRFTSCIASKRSQKAAQSYPNKTKI